MRFVPSSIPAVILVEPQVHADDRGFFLETYQEVEFQNGVLPVRFVQDNHSGSKQGVLRGLHFQVNRPQGKLVWAVAGEVYDVAVDLRKGSTTFGQHIGHRLSAANHAQIWIPAGFAHGFYTLSEWAEVLYKVTEVYVAEWDRTLAWDDPDVGIAWPLIDGRPPILSPKDAQGNRLSAVEALIA